MQPSRPTMFSPYPRRRAILAALLCAFGAALAVAVFVGSALAANNLLANSSFEKDSDGDGIPNNWTLNNASGADKRVCNQSYHGACSFKMVGAGAEIFIHQDLDLAGSGGDSFKLTFWAKTKEIDLDTTGLLKAFVIVYFTGGGTESFGLNISPGTSPWTKYVLELAVSQDYNFIVVELFQDDLAGGKAWVDKVKLAPNP